MSLTYPVFLGAVVIDASNKAVRFTEGGVTETVNLVEGTYFLRGDGQPDDLILAFSNAIESHSGGNTYTWNFSIDPAPGNASALLQIQRFSGASAWSILFADAATTFDPALLGFPASTASGTSSVLSTLSPLPLWVSPEVVEEIEPRTERSAFVNRARSGVVSGGARSNTFDVLDLSFQMVDERRVNGRAITADPARAFDSFLDYVGDGKALEIHEPDLSAGVTSNALSSSTEHGAGWHFSPETVQRFDPQRLEPGVSLYDFSLTLWAHVEPSA